MGKPSGVKHHYRKGPTQGTETSKYLQEKKSTETPLVAASERGTAQTVSGNWGGVVDYNTVLMRIVEAFGMGRHRG